MKKLSTLLWIVTALFVILTVVMAVLYFRSGGEMSTLAVLAPCAVALVFSNLAARARNEGK